MLNTIMIDILERSRTIGWVLEPEAKMFFKQAGLPVPRFGWAKTLPEAKAIAADIGYPVVAKIVSPEVVHKSEVKGVAVGLSNNAEISAFFEKMSAQPKFSGILIEEMVAGEELIVGASIDHQFGPVVLVGIGGTAVEIYQDVAIRMAPLVEKDVESMLGHLKGRKLLSGFRGAEAIDLGKLTEVLLGFSALLMDLEPYIESIDLNPLLCSAKQCLIADARIMLHKDFIDGSVASS